MGKKTASSRCNVLAPAKVNLFLKALRKRPDGYHEILTLMQPVSLYDEIEVATEGPGIRVTVDGPAPEGRENLAYRAAELFFERTGLPPEASVHIKKIIPVGAGLGGGSSDAASVLMSLNTLNSSPLTTPDLIEMGAFLGSDVPFFMLKGPAVARGRGEVLEKVNLPSFWYVLVNPGFHLSTAWVYNNLDLTKKKENNNLTYSEKAFEPGGNFQKYLDNDLEAVSAGKFPAILELKRALLDAGAAGALMSGSGPTVFGVFTDPKGASGAFERLKTTLDGGNLIFLARGL